VTRLRAWREHEESEGELGDGEGQGLGCAFIESVRGGERSPGEGE
jgi:hypothetical protein